MVTPHPLPRFTHGNHGHDMPKVLDDQANEHDAIRERGVTLTEGVVDATLPPPPQEVLDGLEACLDDRCGEKGGVLGFIHACSPAPAPALGLDLDWTVNRGTCVVLIMRFATWCPMNAGVGVDVGYLLFGSMLPSPACAFAVWRRRPSTCCAEPLPKVGVGVGVGVGDYQGASMQLVWMVYFSFILPPLPPPLPSSQLATAKDSGPLRWAAARCLASAGDSDPHTLDALVDTVARGDDMDDRAEAALAIVSLARKDHDVV